MSAEATLTRDVGPFPVWGWLAIGAAGIGAGLLLRRSDLFALGGDEGGGDDAPAPAPATGPNLIGYGGVIGLPASAAPKGDDVNPAEGMTNEKWTKAAVAWLTSERGISGGNADAALRKYLQGLALTTTERRIVDMAIERWGTPPEGAAPLETTPDPPAAGKPGDVWHVGPGLRSHTTSGTESGDDIINRYYGTGGGVRTMQWARLKEANKSLRDGGYAHNQKLPAGMTLVIP